MLAIVQDSQLLFRDEWSRNLEFGSARDAFDAEAEQL
jgi:hypothetical protein